MIFGSTGTPFANVWSKRGFARRWVFFWLVWAICDSTRVQALQTLIALLSGDRGRPILPHRSVDTGVWNSLPWQTMMLLCCWNFPTNFTRRLLRNCGLAPGWSGSCQGMNHWRYRQPCCDGLMQRTFGRRWMTAGHCRALLSAIGELVSHSGSLDMVQPGVQSQKSFANTAQGSGVSNHYYQNSASHVEIVFGSTAAASQSVISRGRTKQVTPGYPGNKFLSCNFLVKQPKLVS